MKVAILFSGPLRGNDEMILLHNKNIGDYDIYVSALPWDLKEWKNSNWKVTQYFETINIDFKSTIWSKFRNDQAGQAGFWQFWNLKHVIENIPQYDWYIKSRNDLVFRVPLNLDFHKLDSGTLYCPKYFFDNQVWNKDETLNDQFFIVSYNTLKIIEKFVTDYFMHFHQEKNDRLGSNERCLRNWLKFNGIKVSEFDFSYTKNHNGYTIPSGYYQFQKEKTSLNLTSRIIKFLKNKIRIIRNF